MYIDIFFLLQYFLTFVEVRKINVRVEYEKWPVMMEFLDRYIIPFFNNVIFILVNTVCTGDYKKSMYLMLNLAKTTYLQQSIHRHVFRICSEKII